MNGVNSSLNSEGVPGRTHNAEFPIAQTYPATNLLFLIPYLDNVHV
jgi:hypothetical protein